ncbi:MAG: CpaD family pilus assembly lipoprotein [Pseudomonadota bacterium]
MFILSACSSVTNGPDQALTIQEEHPIAVDSQVVTLTLDPSDAEFGISSLDTARLRAFGQSYLIKGHGPITFSTPSDRTGSGVVVEAKKLLYDAGVAKSAMLDSEFVATQEGANAVILSYTHYVATPSACGVWKGLKDRDRKNLRSPNFGCASQSNLAAMISDPLDLVRAANGSPPDAEFRIRGVQAFREGMAPSSETDSEIEVEVSN